MATLLVEQEIANLTQPARHSGIPIGSWTPNKGAATYDAQIGLVQDNEGKLVRTNFANAADMVVYTNEKSLREAMKNGTYKDGELALVPREFLDSTDRKADTVCARINSASFKEIKDAVMNNPGGAAWLFTATQNSADPSKIDCVRPVTGNSTVRPQNDHMAVPFAVLSFHLRP